MKAEKIGNYILLALIALLVYANTFINFHWLPFLVSTLLFTVQSYNVYKLYICK
jgi:hypothetical protein